jgi:hypothetical protein
MQRKALTVIAGIICVSAVFSSAWNVPMHVAQGNSAVHHVLADNDEPEVTTG